MRVSSDLFSRINPRRRLTQGALAAGLSAAAVAAMAAPAFASSSTSSVYTYSAKSIAYENFNYINSGGGGQSSYAELQAATQTGGNVPTGWIGAQGRAFYASNGNLCLGQDYAYNTSPADAFGNYVEGMASQCGNNYYFARGFSRAWNGNGYNSYGSYQTANIYIAVTSSSTAPALTGQMTGGAFSKNAKGQTFGSAAYAATPAQEPDLIGAVGTSPSGARVNGYILKREFDQASGANVATPEAAVAFMAARANAAPSSIPLYMSDGTTVIGTFSISPAAAGPPAP